MNVIVLGASGTLGQDLMRALSADHNAVGPSRADADLQSPDTIADVLDEYPCEVLINCAAYADVDGCEKNPALANAVNARGVTRTAVLCAFRKIHFIHVSTDYVFDGTKGSAYEPSDEPNPVQAYGKSKLAGEIGALDAGGDVLIVRTSMLMGAGGNNFANKVLAKADAGEEIRAVTDWVGSPTATLDLADGLVQLMSERATGVVHVVNPGSCSRYEQAEMILQAAGLDAPLTPIQSSELTLAAKRPDATALVSNVELPDRGDAIRRFVEASRQAR